MNTRQFFDDPKLGEVIFIDKSQMIYSRLAKPEDIEVFVSGQPAGESLTRITGQLLTRLQNDIAQSIGEGQKGDQDKLDKEKTNFSNRVGE